MKPTEKIEKLLGNMNVTPAPDKDQQMLNAILQAQEKKQTPAESKPNRWRHIMKNPITKNAAAAIIIVAAIISINVFTGTPAYALEQTIKALHSVRSIHIRQINPEFQDEPVMFWIELFEDGLPRSIRMHSPEWKNGADLKLAFREWLVKSAPMLPGRRRRC